MTTQPKSGGADSGRVPPDVFTGVLPVPAARSAPYPDDGFPPTPPDLVRSLHGLRGRPRREHAWLLRTPAPPLAPPEAFRAADRGRPSEPPSPDLHRDVLRHFQRACAWWNTVPGAADLARAIKAQAAGPDDGIVEAWIGEASTWLWIRAWNGNLYSLEDLVRAAVRTRTDHRLFRHVIGPYARTPEDHPQ